MRIEYSYSSLNYETAKTCPICGSDDFEFFSQVSSQPFFVNEVDGLRFLTAALSTYYKCKQCEVVFQNPHMNETDMNKFYSTGIYVNTTGVPLDAVLKDEAERAERNVKFLERCGVKPKSLLDIGAAHGKLLELAQERLGCFATGYDLFGKYAERDASTEQFEMVSAIHILEHYVDPLAALSRYRALTTKWLLLEVPKSRGKEETKGLRFPHLFVFPYNTLKFMLAKTGFQIVEMEENPDTRILGEIV